MPDKRPRCPKCYTVKWCYTCSNCRHRCKASEHLTVAQIEKAHINRVNNIKSSKSYKS